MVTTGTYVAEFKLKLKLQCACRFCEASIRHHIQTYNVTVTYMKNQLVVHQGEACPFSRKLMNPISLCSNRNSFKPKESLCAQPLLAQSSSFYLP